MKLPAFLKRFAPPVTASEAGKTLAAARGPRGYWSSPEHREKCKAMGRKMRADMGLRAAPELDPRRCN